MSEEQRAIREIEIEEWLVAELRRIREEYERCELNGEYADAAEQNAYQEANERQLELAEEFAKSQ